LFGSDAAIKSGRNYKVKSIVCMLILAGIAVTGAARADIFSFTDANGVSHFS